MSTHGLVLGSTAARGTTRKGNRWRIARCGGAKPAWQSHLMYRQQHLMASNPLRQLRPHPDPQTMAAPGGGGYDPGGLLGSGLLSAYQRHAFLGGAGRRLAECTGTSPR